MAASKKALQLNPWDIMKINATFKLEILKRFLSLEELEELQTSYNEAKVIVLGQEVIKKKDE